MFSPDRFASEKRNNFDSFNPSKTQFQPFAKSNPNVFAKADTETSRPVIPFRSGFRLNPKTGAQYPGSPGGKPDVGGLWGVRKTTSEPATPGIVVKDRGLRPSDLSDPVKRDFLTNLTTRVFHLALEEDSNREKIPLERLFTPATDSGEITPRKKKAFASSDFYAKDHPTIDDQLQLAQRISGSLLDQDNKTSRGQAMYERRKEKSVKWIHQEGEELTESHYSEQQFEAQSSDFSSAPVQQPQPKTKPAMKLVMNPKGVQDINTIESHYQQLMEDSNMSTISSSVVGGATAPSIPPGAVQIPASPEIAKDLINDMQSPTGKGAALFAKRKKRMDKFIVDETNVQKTSAYQQEQQGFVPPEPASVAPKPATFSTQQFSSSTKQTSFSSSSSSSSTQPNKKKSVQERDREQKQIMESFLKNRESTFKIVQSPWEAALETGSSSNAFQKNQQIQSQTFLSSSVTGGVAPSANAPSWLEMPKAVPVTAPLPNAGPSTTLPTPPSLFGTKALEPLSNDGSSSSPGLVYTAQVKVQQTSSLPGTPVDQPGAPPAAQPTAPAPAFVPKPAAPAAVAANKFVPKAAAAPMTPAQKAELEEKRKSGANFNLAATGWGKCNAFYRPTSLSSSS